MKSLFLKIRDIFLLLVVWLVAANISRDLVINMGSDYRVAPALIGLFLILFVLVVYTIFWYKRWGN